jgi:hypothetical protein
MTPGQHDQLFTSIFWACAALLSRMVSSVEGGKDGWPSRRSGLGLEVEVELATMAEAVQTHMDRIGEHTPSPSKQIRSPLTGRCTSGQASGWHASSTRSKRRGYPCLSLGQRH